MYVAIPITSAKTANSDIEIPGVEAIEITKAKRTNPQAQMVVSPRHIPS